VKARDLVGVFGPVVTTYNQRSRDLDLAAFGANAKAHFAAGLAGIVVCGSTGEAALLTEDERLELLESARRDVPMDKRLLMGVGAESTRLTVRRCREAQTIGADAALVVAPHYYSSAMTHEALKTHYTRIADESPLPVVLYNIPKYMHFKLSPELVAELAKHPNVIGIKDSSGDLELLKQYLTAQSETFTVLTGNGGQLHAALMAGARGGILAVALFAAERSARVFAAHTGGDHATAESVQASLKPLAATIVGELGVPGVKVALDEVGLHGGPVRGPLLPLDAAAKARVKGLLHEASAVGV
jgi:4-hydroxy-2-oxoglutarate aldolase